MQAPPSGIAVGRIVHYVAFGTEGGEFPDGVHRAAIITQVLADPEPATVSLTVFNPTWMQLQPKVHHSDFHEPGTWHFPEYVA